MDQKDAIFKLRLPLRMRVIMYGYRSCEIPALKEPVHVTEDFQLHRFTPSDVTLRPPSMVSLGCHVDGACLPHVDMSDADTAYAGACKRVGPFLPKMSVKRRRHFRRFVQRWMKRNLRPLNPSTDFSVEKWLETTHYSLSRKQQLLEKYNNILDPHSRRYKIVKSFIKDETYDDFKHARTINSRTDEFKTLVGPFVKAVEKEVFKNPHFIKYVPMIDRPKTLLDKFDGKYKYINSTDFTSFEAHFDDFLEDTEMALYEYMFQHIPMREFIINLLEDGLLHTNVLVFKNFTVSVWRRRMSGEMSTSLGNGFCNLMLILYITHHIMNEKADPLVEGDDGIFGTFTKPPTPSWLYQELGIKLKIETCENIADASFCGNVFDPVELTNTTCPVSTMLSFGWTTSRYLRSTDKRLNELLRSKALSLIHQYPGCPVLSELAQYALRVTPNVRARCGVTNEYEREQMAEWVGKPLPIKEPGYRTRLLVEKKFGLLVEDQLKIESYLKAKTDLSPISIPCLSVYFKHAHMKYYHNYRHNLDLKHNERMIMPVMINAH